MFSIVNNVQRTAGLQNIMFAQCLLHVESTFFYFYKKKPQIEIGEFCSNFLKFLNFQIEFILWESIILFNQSDYLGLMVDTKTKPGPNKGSSL